MKKIKKIKGIKVSRIKGQKPVFTMRNLLVEPSYEALLEVGDEVRKEGGFPNNCIFLGKQEEEKNEEAAEK